MLMNSGPPNCSTLSSLSPPVIQFFFVEICFYPPISRSKFDVNSRGRNGEREEEGKKKTKERKTKKLHEIEERRGFKLKKTWERWKERAGRNENRREIPHFREIERNRRYIFTGDKLGCEIYLRFSTLLHAPLNILDSGPTPCATPCIWQISHRQTLYV